MLWFLSILLPSLWLVTYKLPQLYDTALSITTVPITVQDTSARAYLGLEFQTPEEPLWRKDKQRKAQQSQDRVT